MTIFLVYLLFFFFAGVALRRVPAGQRALIVLAMSVILAFLYYTLERLI